MPIPRVFASGETGEARVTVRAQDVKVAFKEGGSYTLAKEDCPKWLVDTGNYGVMLNEEGTRMVSCKPLGGSHFAVFDRFVPREGDPPNDVPIPQWQDARSGTKNGKPWKIEAGLVVKPVFRIVGDKYTDFEITYNKLRYCFQQYRQGSETLTALSSTGSKIMEEFLRTMGIDLVNESIPWSDNVLPYLEKKLLEAGKAVVISLNKDGWIDQISQAPEGVAVSRKPKGKK